MSRSAGQQHENRALDFLKSQGLKTVARNFHAYRGEIDLIMQDDDTLVFVEVRYRRNNMFGSAAESVTLKKQQHIAMASQCFLQTKKHYQSMPCRFDVVAISGARAENIDWIKNGFALS